MDPQWLVSICLILFITFIFILTRKTKPEAEGADTAAAYDPVLAYASFGGKHLECSEDDMDRCMLRLSKVLFEVPSETRNVAATSGSNEQTCETRETVAIDPVQFHAAHPPKVQERPTEPAAVEKIMDEIEQAVQETVESELYMRRRQHQPRTREHREGQWSEVIVKPEADSL